MTRAKKKLEITLCRSPIGHPLKHRKILRALGLRRIRQRVVRSNHPTTQGMVDKVRHLVEVRDASA